MEVFSQTLDQLQDLAEGVDENITKLEIDSKVSPLTFHHYLNFHK